MKRLTAIILAAIILLSSFEPVVAAEKSTTESKKIKWMLENNFVVGRGQTKDLKLEDTITRAEFTRMVLVAKGEENLAKEDSTSKADFKDVPNTHWAEKFIAYAKQKGYISGYPDGNFRPEGEITYEEIISILARIHPNYRKIEAKSTNWAEGFINFAKDNGILDDINIKESYKSPAIREKTFEMTYNFIKFVEKQTKSEKVSKTKEEKDVKKENSTWNGFYPYWLGYGFRPSEEKKPDVKPNPDVKPAPDKPDKPEKENPGAETPSEPGTEPENPSEPGTEPENPTEPGKENPPEPGTEPEIPKEFDKTKIDKIEVVSQPSKREYKEDDTLDLTGLTLKLTDNQNLEKEIGLSELDAYGITTDPENGTALTVDNNNGKTVKIIKDEMEVETNLLTVNPKVFNPDHVESITVKTQATKLIYTDGEKLNLTGLVVTLTDNQNLEKEVGLSEFDTYGITTDPENGTDLTVDNNNGKAVKITKGEMEVETNPLTVNKKVFDENNITEIKVNTQPKLVYTEGEKLDLTKLVVTLTDNQGLTKYVAFAEFGSNGITTDPKNGAELKTTDNENPVIITKGNLTITTEVLTVKAKEFDKTNIAKIEVIAPPTKLNYVVGESLNLDGLKVKLTDNQGVTKEIGLTEFDDYKIKTEPEKNKSLTESDNNTKIIIKSENKEIITGNISLTLKVISKADFEKENKIKTNIKNSLVEVYKNLGDLKLGVDNIQNKYYLLFTKDVSEISFYKENLKKSILETIKKNKIKSYTIGETTRDLTKADDEILGFIREDILKIAGLEGNQDVNDAQILEQLKTTKPNTKIKLVAGDENISFDYEIIFLTQMAEEKLVNIENKFINVMNETVEAVPKFEKDNYKIDVSYADKSYKIKFSKNLNKKAFSFSTNYGYKAALTNFLTGEELDKSKTISSLKSIAINSKQLMKPDNNWGMMERLELENLLISKYVTFTVGTKSYHETFGGTHFILFGKIDQLFDFNTAVEYFYVDESNETGGIITRTIHFESIKN